MHNHPYSFRPGRETKDVQARDKIRASSSQFSRNGCTFAACTPKSKAESSQRQLHVESMAASYYFCPLSRFLIYVIPFKSFAAAANLGHALSHTQLVNVYCCVERSQLCLCKQTCSRVLSLSEASWETTWVRLRVLSLRADHKALAAGQPFRPSLVRSLSCSRHAIAGKTDCCCFHCFSDKTGTKVKCCFCCGFTCGKPGQDEQFVA